jgi:hypothetical protein
MNLCIELGFLWTSVVCAPAARQIGKVNLISTRNVETSLDYTLIRSYTGGSKRELRRSRAETIESALAETVQQDPDGEFLANARIFVANDKYFAVGGDGWVRTANVSYRGFPVGGRASFKTPFGIKTGTVEALKDDKACFVKGDEGGVITEFKYDDLVKGADASP